MDTKTCSKWKNEEQNKNFYKRYPECKGCNRTRTLNRYYEKKR